MAKFEVLVNIWLHHELLVKDVPGVTGEGGLRIDNDVDEACAHHCQNEMEDQEPWKDSKLLVLSQGA